MQIVNQTIPLALKNLGYTDQQSAEISEYILKNGEVTGAPYLSDAHYSIFDTAVGDRSISAMGHVNMMAATQPFLSGAISKTVNLPETATVEEIEDVYLQGWRLGLKALAVYRDNCKVGQPLGDQKTATANAAASASTAPAVETRIEYRPVRTRLPRTRKSLTTSFEVGGASGYLTTGEYDNGEVGEVFIKLGKQGSTLAGVMDAFSIATSIGLQYGVPLESYVNKFANMKFEPAGMTDDPDIRIAQSMIDYVFRKLALDYLPYEERAELGIYTSAERAHQVETGVYEEVPENPIHDEIEIKPSQARSDAEVFEAKTGVTVDAPFCLDCGVKMQRAGSCYICSQCGTTSGCS